MAEGKALGLIAWFTGVVVSLVVGSGMINGVLKLPTWLGGNPEMIGQTVGFSDWLVLVVGWIVVITTLIGAVMAILKK